MAIPTMQSFVTINGGNPLVLTQKKDIAITTFKVVSFFTRETPITPTEHIQDVENIYSIFYIIEDNVAVRLLASSLKRKAL